MDYHQTLQSTRGHARSHGLQREKKFGGDGYSSTCDTPTSVVRTLTHLLLIPILFLVAGLQVHAQHTGTITTPTDGASGVSTSPTIYVLANGTIDSSSISWIADTGDSALTVSLIEQEVADSAGGLDWWPVQYSGTFSMPTPDALTFEPEGSLEWDTEYIVILRGLQVLDSLGNPHVIDPDTVTFTTQEAPHHLMSTSHFSGDNLCQCDTIELLFNRQLDSTESPAGPIAIVERVYVDTSNAWGDSVEQVGTGYELSADSLTLRVSLTDTIEIGGSYRIRVPVSRLSGDTLDDRTFPLFSAEQWPVRILSVDESTGDTLNGLVGQVPFDTLSTYAAGDSARLSAGLKSGYVFSRWIAPEIAVVDSATDIGVTFAQPCSPAYVIAEYRSTPYDSVEIKAADSAGYATAYSADLDSLGGPGMHGYAEGDVLYLKAISDNGYRFSEWESNITAIDGSTSPLIRLADGETGWIKPGFDDPFADPEVEYKYCGAMYGRTEALAWATLSTTCHTTDEAESKSITCNITSPNGGGECYRIIGRIDPDGTVHDWTNNPKTTDTKAWTTSESVPTTQWFVEPYPNYTLDVTIEDLDGNPIASGASVEVIPNKESYMCGETVMLVAHDDVEDGVTFEEWQPGNSSNKTLILTMDENKSITAVFDESFAVVAYHWFQTSTTTETRFSPYQTVPDVQILTMTPENSTEVVIEFNRPVNIATVDEKQLYIEESGERIDGEPLFTYEYGEFYVQQWYDNNTKLKLRLYDDNADVAVGKMQPLEIHIGEGIESAAGADLDNPHVHYAITENPDVDWGMKVWVTYDTDPGGSGEIYGMFNAVRLNPQRELTQWEGEMPGGDPETVSAGGTAVLTSVGDGHGFLAPSINDDEVLEIGIVIMDEDAGDVIAQVQAILEAVTDAIAVLADAGVISPISTAAIAAKLVGAINEHLGDFFQDDDDHVTNANFRYGQVDHWGAKATNTTVWRSYGGIELVVTLE